jgi:hypothetical protein
MKYIGTSVYRTGSGGYKAMIWGQSSSHLMDWRGCNFRRRSLPGQPHRGFETVAEAEGFARRVLGTDDKAREWASTAGDGSHMSDDFDHTNVCF